MTRKLYYDNVNQKEFSSTVTGIEKKGRNLYVELESTCFYPEGGGQPGDKGFLGSFEVMDTRKEGDRILHVCKLEDRNTAESIKEGEEIIGKINWPWRIDFMQQHTGQHILSAALLRTADSNTVSVHHGEEYVTIEIDKPDLSEEMIEAVEDSAQEAICRNLPVRTVWVEEENIAQYNLRRPPKKHGTLRLVDIPDFDCAACGGLHTETTGDVRLIKWIGSEKIRNRLRLYWKIGNRAFQDYRQNTKVLSEINTLLSARTLELPERINKCMEEIQELKKSIASLQNERAEQIAQALSAAAVPNERGILVLGKIFEREDSGFLKKLMKECINREKCAVCFINRDNSGINWMIGVSLDIDFPFPQKREELLAAVQGKGGGKHPLWQGRGDNFGGADEFMEIFSSAF